MFPHHHFYHAISASSDGSGFWGAFGGAFFAFIFGLIAYRITKRWERYMQHKNVLVKLERLLNRHYNELAILELIEADTSRIVAQGKLTSNRFFKLSIKEDLDLDLASVELINKLFEYQSSIDRYNLNASTFNHALTRFEDMLIAGNPLPVENLAYAQKMLAGMKKDLPQLGGATRDLLLLVRIHLIKIRERNSFIYGVSHSQWDFEITPQEIEAERKKLEAEIASIQKPAV